MPVNRILAIMISLLVSGCGVADEPGALSHFAMTDSTVQQWRLPDRLREISGLALSPDGRLFAVADEMAVVYEINYAEGKLIRAFALQAPPVPGDFEGIAWLKGQIYLTTSDGILYSSPEGADGEHVEATRTDTGLGASCEIEGLAEESQADHLFFVCKDRIAGSKVPDLQIFEWSVADQRVVRSIALPLADIQRTLGTEKFNPSGIVLDRSNKHFFIVAAEQRGLAELGTDGQLIAARRFAQPGRHRQAEGIELTSSGKLLIADEGGDGKARLAVYESRQGVGSPDD
jgi:uncharacterized protein YjiK